MQPRPCCAHSSASVVRNAREGADGHPTGLPFLICLLRKLCLFALGTFCGCKRPEEREFRKNLLYGLRHRRDLYLGVGVWSPILAMTGSDGSWACWSFCSAWRC